MKNKITVFTKFGYTGWLKCPHCKKLIVFGEKHEVEMLSKWKKQKPLKTNR